MEDCNRMAKLEPPLTTIGGVLLCLASVFAAVGNTLVLIIVYKMKSKRTRSITILSSLAFSDLLVGTVLGPITAWQQFSVYWLSHCVVDKIRGYFVVLLVGSSVMTLAVVSYDRYILLTKLKNYNKHMTKRKAVILIAFSWTIPALMPIIRQFDQDAYLVNIFILYVAPLIVLGICYCFIMVAISAKEKELKRRRSTVKHGPSSGESSVNNDFPKQREPSADYDSQISSSQASEGTKSVRREQKNIRLAKTVALLIVCYTICIIPMNVWIALEFFKDKDIFGYQVLYLCAMLLMQINSCINPIIYFSKNPDFKRGLKKLFKRENESSSNITLMFSKFSLNNTKL